MLSDHFGVRRDAIGVTGLKDKLAVTRQLFSVHVPGKKPEDFPAELRFPTWWCTGWTSTPTSSAAAT